MARLAVRSRLSTIVMTGLVAGIIFAVFEMFAAALMMGIDAAVMPLRMIGAIVLGPAALDPGYSLAVAAITGVLVHVTLSVAFVGIFAAMVAAIPNAGGGTLLSSARGLSLAGIIFGTALWLVNFYLIAPAAGWTWFPEQSNPVVQFLAHTVFFGCPAGWMLGRLHPLAGPTL